MPLGGGENIFITFVFIFISVAHGATLSCNGVFAQPGSYYTDTIPSQSRPPQTAYVQLPSGLGVAVDRWTVQHGYAWKKKPSFRFLVSSFSFFSAKTLVTMKRDKINFTGSIFLRNVGGRQLNCELKSSHYRILMNS